MYPFKTWIRVFRAMDPLIMTTSRQQRRSQQLSVGLWVEHLATNVNHEFLQGVEVPSHSSI